MSNLLSSDVVFQESSPQAITIPDAPTNVLGFVGIAERGPLAVESGPLASFPQWQTLYGGYTTNNSDAIAAVKGFFDNGGTELHYVRTAHFTDATDPTTKTSASGTLMLETAADAPSAGEVTASNTGPYALQPGDTLKLKIDGGGTLTTTFTGTAGYVLAADSQPYAITDGWTLQGTVNGANPWEVTFHTSEFASIGAALASEVVAVLNAAFAAGQVPANAVVSGTAVEIVSDQLGSGSAVAITGGTAAGAFAFAATAGTGNVPNLAAVTVSQLVALVLATGGVASNSSGALRITSDTTGGSSSVQVLSSSTTGAEFGFDFAVHSGSSGAAVNTIQVNAKSDGAFSSSLTTAILPATSGAADHFNFNVLDSGIVAEPYANVSMDPTAADYVVTVVNAASNLVQLVDELADVPSPLNLPAQGTFGPLEGGNDGLAGLADADFVGGAGSNGDVGLNCLDVVSTLSLLGVPGRATPAVHNAMITYVEIYRAGLVFAILDPPKDQSASEIVDYVVSTAFLSNLSEYGAIYWPNVLVANPSTAVYGSAPTLVAPPSGALAGMFAKNDASQPAGVFQAPAGLLNPLVNVLGVEMPEVNKKSARDIVFPGLTAVINPIRSDTSPVYVDGAVTLKYDGNFPTIGERRGVIYLEASMKTGLAPLKQQNITPRLWQEGYNASYLFLEDLCQNGAFASTDPAEAFALDWGPGLNTPSVQRARQVLALVSVATAAPAQWIVVNVSPDLAALDQQFAAAQAA